MTEQENIDPRTELSVWCRESSDGKSEIKLNNFPATIAHAEELGWKRKKVAKSKED